MPTIKFTCSWCDTEVQVGLELEGKQTPCPECKRIVKVPTRAREAPKDWRQVDKRPIPLKKDVEAAPADAWGSGTTSAVSREALEEAGVIKEPVEPVSRGQQIKRIALIALGIVAVGAAFFFVRDYFALTERDKAVNRVLPFVYPPEGKEPLRGEPAGAVHLALGELYRRSRMPDKAMEEYKSARGALSQYPDPTSEHDALLMDIVLGMFELGGGKEEVKEHTHLNWPDVRKELAKTSLAQQSSQARAETIRQLFPRASVRKEDPSVLAAGLNLDDKPEAMGVIGLERFRAGQAEAAKETAKSAHATWERALEDAKSKNRPVPVAPSLVALWLVLNEPDKAKALKPEGAGARADLAYNQGTVEAQGRLAQLDALRPWIQRQPPVEQVRYGAILAGALLDKDPKDAGDLEALVAQAEALKGQPAGPAQAGFVDLSWLLYRVVRLAARGGHEEQAKKLAEAIPDTAVRGRAQLEIVRARLDKATGKVDDAVAEEVDKTAPAYGVARAAIARHNACHAGLTAKAVDAWDDALKPFGYVGVALGIQDKDSK